MLPYNAYPYPYDAAKNAFAPGTAQEIAGKLPRQGFVRSSIAYDGKTRLYVMTGDTVLLRYTLNAARTTFAADAPAQTYSIVEAPADAGFDGFTVYYQNQTTVLALRSRTYLDVLYQFALDPASGSFRYENGVPGRVRVVGAPELCWADFAIAATSGKLKLYAYNIGNIGIYVADYDPQAQQYSFPPQIEVAAISEITQLADMTKLSVIDDGTTLTLYTIYNETIQLHRYGDVEDETSPSSDRRVLQNFDPLHPPPPDAIFFKPKDHSTWMTDMHLSDGLSFGKINLPGTHDSAAIRPFLSSLYSCQNYSISDQLYGGVRMFDIRIKIVCPDFISWLKGDYHFLTCHGALGSILGVNEYEALESVFDAFATFLGKNTKEAIAVSLKIDDWNGYEKYKTDVKSKLKAFLAKYKSYIYTSNNMPVLRDVRGKAYLLNRIDSSLDFGVPISIADNTVWQRMSVAPNRTFEVGVQDHYDNKAFAFDAKLKMITDAFANSSTLPMTLNFISGNQLKVRGLYMGYRLLDYFGSMDRSTRPQSLGWCLFDYVFSNYPVSKYAETTCVDLVIDSNNAYAKYPDKFEILNEDL